MTLQPSRSSVLYFCCISIALLNCLIQVRSCCADVVPPPPQTLDQFKRFVVNTWPFTSATRKAWKILEEKDDSMDAVMIGINVCERERCDGSVGFGGSPNEKGETTLDALLMDGKTRAVGAVANMKQVKDAVYVARKVMDDTFHSMIVGEDATMFAQSVGFKLENLTTPDSYAMWQDWIKRGRIPNYWKKTSSLDQKVVGHDTIGMISMDSKGHLSCGTSTNGLSFRIPGRVGDSPIPGAGSYCEDGVGGAAGTGNGDYLVRFLPSVKAVMYMKLLKLHPRDACKTALQEMWDTVPEKEKDRAFGGLVCVDANGRMGAHAVGDFTSYFKVSVRTEGMEDVQVFNWRDL